MKRLKNKAVVITGGAGGIGKSTAQKMIEEGARVLITDLDEAALKKVSEEINSPELHYLAADVTDEAQVKAYALKAKELFGTVDVFFNNAGIEGEVKPLDVYSLDMYHKIIEVNINGVYYGLRHIFPLMKEKGGSVIITSSVAGMAGTANVLPYVTSKHATVGMMRSAALEGAPYKIRVNTINPSPVDNRMMRSLEEGFSPGEAKTAKENFEKTIPLGRYANNEEIAALAVFLASDESSFITGAVHPVDGGMTA
ncbi:SDR family NAD(P)-dependent oxidoreductase [Geofilum rubicundum]|uniref:3-oxoacyl-[acyl-carrier protein] reductase n=1 Tax=Geofilum rubicundum JCM 15548 TaxID=1236989 RepID=A0A0E9M1A6_9BACT|nr:SDR family NAD(P)-dependent oxidoreductase [Geofilum rubicundum]GAO31259.1 3-oxoacyl-[acyl-carrier protein] reductase [Geofilum rubicundum JCM 15548]